MIAALALLTACKAPVDIGDVTWHSAIRPIIVERCTGCHATEGGISFPLDDPATIAALGDTIIAVAAPEGDDAPPYYMPPFGARESAECTPTAPFRNDPRLSSEQIALLVGWLDAGAPVGEEADAAPLPEPPATELIGTPQVSLDLPSYTLQAGLDDDQYRCFPVSGGNPADVWVTGMQILPGNDKVVHHVVVFNDPSNQGPAKITDQGSYPCFGDAGVDGGNILFAWAPGGQPFELPEDAGMRVAGGGGLVVQVHYSPDGTEQTDQSALAVRYSEQPLARSAEMRVIGAVFEQDGSNPWLETAPFSIAPGDSDAVEIWRQPADGTARVFSVFPHMHLAGRQITVSIERGGASEECLLDVPKWDFNWQFSYSYDGSFEQLPEIREGDEIVVECHYDNTVDNPQIAEMLDTLGYSGPQTITVGEDTLDEMCVAIVGVVF